MWTHIHRISIASVLAASIAFVACGGDSTPNHEPLLKVVATTSILADLAKNVGGDEVKVSVLIPPGADVHSFQSTPKDSISISEAAVIVSNGFGLDDFLQPILDSAISTETVQVTVTNGLEPGGFEDDPHFWQNPLFVIHYVERIRDGLIQVDPNNSQAYKSNTAAYIRQLGDLDIEIEQTLDEVPPERRHLVTFHDAFGYFGERYGWKVSAFVAGDASDVTPGAVISIIEEIRKEGFTAVFAEPQFSPDVMEQVAEDTGVRTGIIYSDTLDDKVTTYIDMMRFNATSLRDNLR